jgi:acetoin utilization deacetylase AcuC-like enzyme
MVADITSFSPSAGKPREVMNSWRKLGIPLHVMMPVPVTVDQFCLAHDRTYVEGVLNCRINNGFGNKSRAVADSLPWTSGAMLSAARYTVINGGVAVAPCSGFHHSSYSSGAGYCSLNGLLVTAAVLLDEGIVKRVGICDLDAHFGDGSEDIIRELRLESRVLHYSAGEKWHEPSQAETFLQILPSIVESFAGCDVLLYQAGADPHIDDPLGGWMTTAQLAERDKIVFQTVKRIGLPTAFDLAGGYQSPLRRVLDIHDNTLLACANSFLATNEGASHSYRRQVRGLGEIRPREQGPTDTDITAEELQVIHDQVDAEIEKGGFPTDDELRQEVESLNH